MRWKRRLDAKHSDAVLALAKQALQRFGETPRLLQHLTPIKTIQRQPGLARRSALLYQLWSTTLRLPSSRPGNQLNTYEHNGDAYWLEYLNSSTLKILFRLSRNTATICCSLPVLNQARYGDVNQSYITALRQAADFHRCCDVGNGRNHLKITSTSSHCGLVGSLVIFLPTL